MSKNIPLRNQTTSPAPNDPGGPGTPIVGPDLLLESGAVWEKYKLAIAAGAALLVLALVGSEYYRSSRLHAAEAASAELDAAKTISEYQKVIDTYPNTMAAANAYMLLAREQADAKDYAGAAATWQMFVEKFPKHPLVASGLLARGSALEAQGKLDEARTVYQSVATGYAGDYAAPTARLSEAALLKSQRRLDDARRIYENIIATFPNSTAASQAKDELRFLSALPPLGAPAPTPVPSPTTATSPVASVTPVPAPTASPTASVAPATTTAPAPLPAASPAASPVAPTVSPIPSPTKP